MKGGFEDFSPKPSSRAEPGPSLQPKTPLRQDTSEPHPAEQNLRRHNAELEQRLHQRTAQLEAANQELEAFSYSVSHDLRAPLRHILGFAKLLREEANEKLSVDARQSLERITGSAQRMEALLEDLLQFSRSARQPLRLAEVELSALLKETIRQLEPHTQGRKVTWKLEALPRVQADPALLRQVFLNLLGNALKFSRARNPALIQVGCGQGAPGEAVVFVKDNGIGFNMKYAGQLFGVFQRLHLREDFEGAGMGLALVRRLISRHGGRTWAEGEVDRGACFYFSLPGT